MGSQVSVRKNDATLGRQPMHGEEMMIRPEKSRVRWRVLKALWLLVCMHRSRANAYSPWTMNIEMQSRLFS